MKKHLSFYLLSHTKGRSAFMGNNTNYTWLMYTQIYGLRLI